MANARGAVQVCARVNVQVGMRVHKCAYKRVDKCVHTRFNVRAEAQTKVKPFSVLLLAVPEAVLSHTKVRRISSTGPSFARNGCPDAKEYK